MSTKASSHDDSLEINRKFLPPAWVDIQEEIERILESINIKSIYLITYLLIIPYSKKFKKVIAIETKNKLY